MLFLALKKVQMFKITPHQIPTSQQHRIRDKNEKGGDVKMEFATYYFIFQSHLRRVWEK